MPGTKSSQTPDEPERAHRVQATVPRVEVADDRDRACVRRPDGERRARDAFDLAHVRAELLVQLLELPLAEQLQIEIAKRRQKRIRVAQREGAVGVLDLELVLERQLRLRQQRLPEARRILQRRLDALRLHAHGAGVRTIRADDDAAAVGLVSTKYAVRVCSKLDHGVRHGGNHVSPVDPLLRSQFRSKQACRESAVSQHALGFSCLQIAKIMV